MVSAIALRPTEVVEEMDRPGHYLLSDLIRSTWAYYGFRLAAAPFFRNRGGISVRAPLFDRSR